MIVYTCPECGGDLRFSTILTYPPTNITECPFCGWREEKMEKIERTPYKSNSQHDHTVDDSLLKEESYSKADVVAMLEKLRQEIDMMSDSVVDGRNVTITSWGGMQKRICDLIQSKIKSLGEVKDGQ